MRKDGNALERFPPGKKYLLIKKSKTTRVGTGRESKKKGKEKRE